uniref:DNA topoisomerase 2 n=1 Tax=Iridovirus LCIVAC01 TaxID=2506607 RepID=A0A481YPP8_9VIRU|nr:MAG: DNA topoisomerase II [Iridovirus LCIVAC01]
MAENKKLTYKQLRLHEQILHRPDNYVGCMRMQMADEYVADIKEEGEIHISKQKIRYVPALLRIFIEAISNAIDNKWRSDEMKVPCNKIMINIDSETGLTQIWNDGFTIPIEINEQTQVYNPEMIFGKLLTSSNYDDSEQRLTSGRNGIGIKLCNIFSKFFKIKTLDPGTGLLYEQSWSDNMNIRNKPKIKKSKLKRGYTEVSWIPDFERCELTGYNRDILKLYAKYVCDAAMLTRVSVLWNDTKLPIKNLVDYAKLYAREPISEILKLQSRNCEVILIPSQIFQPIAFTNGVINPEGGVHVDAWSEAIFRPLVNKFNKPKKPQISIRDIRQFFKLFINCIIPNPVFESNNKMRLTGPKDIKAEVTSRNITSLMKWSFAEKVQDIIRGKELLSMKKSEKKKRGFKKIEGLDPANNAGGKYGRECTLILCEGLSAKTYAVTGIQVGIDDKKGRDWYGIYPMRGKCLNVRNASPTSISKNKEITDIIQALGVRHGIDYMEEDNFRTLNYGKVMIMCDSDCFTNDTPLLVKKDNMVDVISIETLEKENTSNDYQVWTETGWTSILGITKKETCKKILEINTYCGVLKCTEDHKCMLENGTEILAKDISAEDRLLRTRRIPKIDTTKITTQKDIREKCKSQQCYKYGSLTKFEDMVEIVEKENLFCHPLGSLTESTKLTKEEAYVWGLFFAEGSCDIYTFEKDRKKTTERNTEKSRLRWKKWVLKYEKRIEEFDEKESLTKKEKKKYYNAKIRLKNAKQNVNRISTEKKENLTRTNYSWHIDNCDISLLEKAKSILEQIYDYEWKIVETSVKENRSRSFRLILNGGNKTKSFIELMRNRFYDPLIRKNKKVPKEILNGSLCIKELFFQGYYDGDGFRYLLKNKNSMGFDILGQIGAQGLCYLTEQLGYCSSIKPKPNKNDVYTVIISKRFRRYYPGKVKSVKVVDYKHPYVYDIETKNHHVNAGVGGIVVHNCDGIHIAGLILNFFHSLFPSLMNRKESFIMTMQTPIVRIFLKNSELLFYNELRFREYIRNNPNQKHQIKYYKGLGTSSDKEVRETFGKKVLEYILDNDGTENMNKVFNSKEANKRKKWLAEYDSNNIPEEGKQMNISDFLNTEMIKFSIDDCKRSIPHIMDGLKESHRKILFSCFLRNLKSTGKSLKVAQLAGFVAEKTNYHHGEQCLFDTITKMAQDFPGSNNIPLLFRDGQFGSRLAGGKDAANARYIFTKLEKLTRLIFPEQDDILLENIVDEGNTVEPKFYAPIIPMILVNGCVAGIGTGYSCSIPCYNPRNLIECIKIWLDSDGDGYKNEDIEISQFPDIIPWYRGFEGKIEKLENGKYITRGRYKDSGRNRVIVDELPIGMWTDKFKEYLENMLEHRSIKKIRNYSTPQKVKFEITECPNGTKCNQRNLRLTTTLSTTNMVLFNSQGKIKKYSSVDEIIDEFCKIRFEYYKRRKKYTLKEQVKKYKHLKNKHRFINDVIEEKLHIYRRPEEDIIEDLKQKEYNTDKGSYDYLLNISMRSFTQKKLEELEKEIKKIVRSVKDLKKTSEKEMWLQDLNKFEKAYNSFE